MEAISLESRAVLPPKALGDGPPLSCFWWWLAILGLAWLVAASFNSLPPSLHGLLPVSLSSHAILSVSKSPLLIRTLVSGSRATLIQYDLSLTNDVCKDAPSS